MLVCFLPSSQTQEVNRSNGGAELVWRLLLMLDLLLHLDGRMILSSTDSLVLSRGFFLSEQADSGWPVTSVAVHL